MSELIARQNKRIKEQSSTVKVATKTSMAQFNRHYKKTGERKYDLLKYKEVKK